MVMFMMALCLGIFGLAVSAIAFSAATGGARPAGSDARAAQPAAQATRVETRFFAVPAPAAAAAPRVPLDVLLLQLDRHVRLEQAAAESFLSVPTLESLHSRTTSPLVH